MIEDWAAPDWGEPWEPQKELKHLKEAAKVILSANSDLHLELDAQTEGCLFIEIRREDILIGTYTVSAHSRTPLYSFYMGKETDELHVTNLALIAEIPRFYTTEYQLEENST